jgi:hypothetical protein
MAGMIKDLFGQSVQDLTRQRQLLNQQQTASFLKNYGGDTKQERQAAAIGVPLGMLAGRKIKEYFYGDPEKELAQERDAFSNELIKEGYNPGSKEFISAQALFEAEKGNYNDSSKLNILAEKMHQQDLNQAVLDQQRLDEEQKKLNKQATSDILAEELIGELGKGNKFSKILKRIPNENITTKIKIYEDAIKKDIDKKVEEQKKLDDEVTRIEFIESRKKLGKSIGGAVGSYILNNPSIPEKELSKLIGEGSKGTVSTQNIGLDRFGGMKTEDIFYRTGIGIPDDERQVILSTKTATTTEQRQAGIDATETARAAIKEGVNIFFSSALNDVIGFLDQRTVKGETVLKDSFSDFFNTQSPEWKKENSEGIILQGRIKRFVTARVLDVARKLAPVTDLDAKQLSETLMPTVDFTTVEEMETFFAQEFAPKVVAALKAKDVIGAVEVAADYVSYTSSQLDKNGERIAPDNFADEVIMSLPKASRVAQSTNEAIYTFKDPRFRGKAVTEGLIQSFIKSSGAETKEDINRVRNSFDLYQAAK